MDTTAGRRFRAADAAVAAMALSLLGSLVAPGLAQQAADARRTKCLNNVKAICLGLVYHEDAKAAFPLASTAPITAEPGNVNDAEKKAGFSWHAQILPFIDQVALYDAMRESSEKMTLSPLDPAVRVGAGKSARLVATVQIGEFVCPGFDGKRVVDVESSDYRVDETAGGAPAITNYYATTSTHLVPHADVWRLGNLHRSILDGNGAIPLASAEALKQGWQRVRGVTFAGVSRDGSSNTFMFTEGREQGYAAWIDGQVAWTVAAWPAGEAQPELLDAENNTKNLRWKDASQGAVGIARQPHGAKDAEAGVYLAADRWSGAKDRKFGPSGNHPGVAAHGFADAHGSFVSIDVDPVVYLHLTTRGGGEVIPEAARPLINQR